MTSLDRRQLLSEDEYLDAQDEFGEDNFTAMIGAEAVSLCCQRLNLKKSLKWYDRVSRTGSKKRRN